MLKYTQLPGKPRYRLRAAILLASAKGQCSLAKTIFSCLMPCGLVFSGCASETGLFDSASCSLQDEWD